MLARALKPARPMAVIALIVLLVAGCGGGTPAPGTIGPGADGSVSIVDFAFQPAQLTVATGTTVQWTNTGSATHTVTADDGSFDSGRLSGGSHFSHTFSAAGTFTYHCSIHPSMQATIVVTP
jgi:plastocyanin